MIQTGFGGLIKKHASTLSLCLVTAFSTAIKPAIGADIQPFTCGESVHADYLTIPVERGYGINQSDTFISCVSAGNASTTAGTTGAYLTDFPTAANGKNQVVAVKLYYKDDGVARKHTTVRLCAITPRGMKVDIQKPLALFKTKGPDAKGFYQAEWTLIKITTQSSVVSCSIIVNAKKTATNIRFGDINFAMVPAVPPYDLSVENAGCKATQRCF